jgi:Zn-dependent protease
VSGWRDSGDEQSARGGWESGRSWLDSPLRWSIPFGRIAEIDVRLHLLLPLLFLIELTRAAMGHTALGVLPTSIVLLWLLLSVLLHELGHCVACRRMGGHADEILLWPLGGLAGCRPPHDWASHFWTAAAGPLVNLGLLLVTATVLLVAGMPLGGTALPHPFDPAIGMRNLGGSLLLESVFLLGWINLVLLLLNLVPMLPLDGGRMLQALAWRRQGAVVATRTAIRCGYIAAIALAVAGLILDRLLLLGLAVLGGLWSWMTAKRLEQRDDPLLGEGDSMPAGAFAGGGSGGWMDLAEPPRSDRGERSMRRRAAAQEAALRREQLEIDRILDKIRERGMRGLSLRERWRLWRASRRRRNGG